MLAIVAKEAKVRVILKQADLDIAAGKDRNEAIFESRAAGVTLEKIGLHFDITRERVRQIFDKEATKRAYEHAIKTSQDVKGE